MSNADAYRHGLTGRAKKNPYPSGSSEWKSWNLGKASRGRGMRKNPASPRYNAAAVDQAIDSAYRTAPAGPYYVMKAGKKIYRKTLAAAHRLAQSLADALDESVTVHEARRTTNTARARLR